MTASKKKQNRLAAIEKQRDEARNYACDEFRLASTTEDARQGLMAAQSCRSAAKWLSDVLKKHAANSRGTYQEPADALTLIGQSDAVLKKIEVRHHLASIPGIMEEMDVSGNDRVTLQYLFGQYTKHLEGAGLNNASDAQLVEAGVKLDLVEQKRIALSLR